MRPEVTGWKGTRLQHMILGWPRLAQMWTRALRDVADLASHASGTKRVTLRCTADREARPRPSALNDRPILHCPPQSGTWNTRRCITNSAVVCFHPWSVLSVRSTYSSNRLAAAPDQSSMIQNRPGVHRARSQNVTECLACSAGMCVSSHEEASSQTYLLDPICLNLFRRSSPGLRLWGLLRVLSISRHVRGLR